MKRLTNNKRGYDSRWEKARSTYLKSHPLCVECEKLGFFVSATVVDHIIPHRLGAAINACDEAAIRAARLLFWDKTNWQPLCTTHHSKDKQILETRGDIGCDARGYPLSKKSHWNKEQRHG